MYSGWIKNSPNEELCGTSQSRKKGEQVEHYMGLDDLRCLVINEV